MLILGRLFCLDYKWICRLFYCERQRLFMYRDSAVVFSASTDGVLKTWELNLGAVNNPEEQASVFQEGRSVRNAHDGAINCIHVSINGRFLATGSRDKTAKVTFISGFCIHFLWLLNCLLLLLHLDLVSGRFACREGHAAEIVRLAGRPQAKYLVRSFLGSRTSMFVFNFSFLRSFYYPLSFSFFSQPPVTRICVYGVLKI